MNVILDKIISNKQSTDHINVYICMYADSIINAEQLEELYKVCISLTNQNPSL